MVKKYLIASGVLLYEHPRKQLGNGQKSFECQSCAKDSKQHFQLTKANGIEFIPLNEINNCLFCTCFT